jgi:hypothetical protein
VLSIEPSPFCASCALMVFSIEVFHGLRPAKIYSDERLEAASQQALQLQACSYSKSALDPETLARAGDRTQSGIRQDRSRHENVCGADYYDPPTRCCTKKHHPRNRTEAIA